MFQNNNNKNKQKHCEIFSADFRIPYIMGFYPQIYTVKARLKGPLSPAYKPPPLSPAYKPPPSPPLISPPPSPPLISPPPLSPANKPPPLPRL